MWGSSIDQCQICFQISTDTDICSYVDCRGGNCYSVICLKCKKEGKVPIKMTKCSKCDKICCYMYHYHIYYTKCLMCERYINKYCKDHTNLPYIHDNCRKTLINITNIPKDLLNIVLCNL